MSMTKASGRATWAPMAAGSPKPIVPNPPEVMNVARVSDQVVLSRPHLILAHLSTYNGLAARDLPDLAYHELRHDLAVGRIPHNQRMTLFPALDLTKPGLMAPGRSCFLSSTSRAARTRLASPTMGTSAGTFFGYLRRINVYVDECGAGANFSREPVTRSSKRTPTANTRSAWPMA